MHHLLQQNLQKDEESPTKIESSNKFKINQSITGKLKKIVNFGPMQDNGLKEIREITDDGKTEGTPAKEHQQYINYINKSFDQGIIENTDNSKTPKNSTMFASGSNFIQGPSYYKKKKAG